MAYASNTKKSDDKFSTNWKLRFQVIEDADKGTYKLEPFSRQLIPNTWDVTHLKLYFS